MGWRLAEEIAWARPERPGPEWWTLMDIAQDARDDTRQGMPGHEYLMARGKCSKRTLYRRLKTLTDAGLLTVARRSAPGVRAIYEIEVIHRLPETGATNADTRSPVDNPPASATNADTRPEVDGCHFGPQRVPETGPTGASVSGTHAVSITPSLHPSNLSPVVGGAVEGTQPPAKLSTDQDHELAAAQDQTASRPQSHGRHRKDRH